MTKTNNRIEHDSMGSIEVPEEALYGAQNPPAPRAEGRTVEQTLAVQRDSPDPGQRYAQPVCA